jgi:hypothetical protein
MEPATAAPAAAEPSRGFVPVDPATQPQAGETAIQVPDPASDREIKGQYGLGIVLLVLGGLVSAALVVALFRIVVRRSWESHDAPASQGRH